MRLELFATNEVTGMRWHPAKSRVEISDSGACMNRRMMRGLLLKIRNMPPMARSNDRKPNTNRNARYGGLGIGASSRFHGLYVRRAPRGTLAMLAKHCPVGNYGRFRSRE